MNKKERKLFIVKFNFMPISFLVSNQHFFEQYYVATHKNSDYKKEGKFIRS